MARSTACGLFPLKEGMILQLDITGIRPAEIPFAFDQDEQLDSRSGCIGSLQGNFGAGREFYPTRIPTSLCHQLEDTSEMAALFAQPQEDWITYIE